jgi:succinate dehydrogenase/fumarate reductase flavoprotein subunit
MAEKGVGDSREDALKYCKALTRGRAADGLMEAYLDTGPEMVKYLEKHTPLRMECITLPDYHPEMEGAHSGESSRSLGPLIFNTNDLGGSLANFRPNPIMGLPMTHTEMEKWNALSKPYEIPFDVIQERMEAGFTGLGGALMGPLYKGCLDRGIEPMLKTRGLELIMADDQAIGLLAKQGDRDFYIDAGKGVILACGGFEWNDELKAQFLPADITHPNSPPHNEGDGLKMAMAVGADLGNMSENWGFVSMVTPGVEYDGRPLNQACLAERSLPHSIIVNKKGKRFVNEAANYNDMSKPFYILDPNTCEYTNLPAWIILDQQYFDNYSFMGILPGSPVPDHVERAHSLDELAEKVGMDPAGLAATIKRFNEYARKGLDPDFQRGESEYDRYYGDKTQRPNPNLGTIEKPPFYALQVHCGTLGTKGGPKTNKKGQVLHVSGKPIPGLYAAGNVAAGVSGPSYWGAGVTVGLAMVFGYIAGRYAAKQQASN